MPKRQVPTAPSSLREPGKALWQAILSDLPDELELDARELHALGSACRCRDEIALLEQAIDEAGVTVRGSRGQPVVNRAVEEVRMMRLAEARLLSSIGMEIPAQAAAPSSDRARHAAQARWRREGERRASAKAS